ncbi:hypothetical protein EYF80_001630 [Liparis tanakae]|uniref:Uncharacterized protein n=1 Tax=Liparis tanakae TaxID=230148 RepID=A0A4Z2JCW1_9TELE|nr:hypothetical protein EYF80_001630 [Liparis tanakae]
MDREGKAQCRNLRAGYTSQSGPKECQRGLVGRPGPEVQVDPSETQPPLSTHHLGHSQAHGLQYYQGLQQGRESSHGPSPLPAQSGTGGAELSERQGWGGGVGWGVSAQKKIHSGGRRERRVERDEDVGRGTEKESQWATECRSGFSPSPPQDLNLTLWRDPAARGQGWVTSGADKEETQSLYPEQREGRLNVTLKSNKRIDSGPSGSTGKYLGQTGDTKPNNKCSRGKLTTSANILQRATLHDNPSSPLFFLRTDWDRDGSSRSWTVKTGGGPSQSREGLFDERRRIEEA